MTDDKYDEEELERLEEKFPLLEPGFRYSSHLRIKQIEEGKDGKGYEDMRIEESNEGLHYLIMEKTVFEDDEERKKKLEIGDFGTGECYHTSDGLKYIPFHPIVNGIDPNNVELDGMNEDLDEDIKNNIIIAEKDCHGGVQGKSGQVIKRLSWKVSDENCRSQLDEIDRVQLKEKLRKMDLLASRALLDDKGIGIDTKPIKRISSDLNIDEDEIRRFFKDVQDYTEEVDEGRTVYLNPLVQEKLSKVEMPGEAEQYLKEFEKLEKTRIPTKKDTRHTPKKEFGNHEMYKYALKGKRGEKIYRWIFFPAVQKKKIEAKNFILGEFEGQNDGKTDIDRFDCNFYVTNVGDFHKDNGKGIKRGLDEIPEDLEEEWEDYISLEDFKSAEKEDEDD